METCCWFTKSDGKSLVRLSTRSLSAGELLALQRLISISRARQLWGQCVDLHNVSDHIIMVLIIVIALMRISQDVSIDMMSAGLVKEHIIVSVEQFGKRG